MSIDDMNVVYAFGQLNIHIQHINSSFQIQIGLVGDNEGWKHAMIE